jgi:hypothetical protein
MTMRGLGPGALAVLSVVARTVTGGTSCNAATFGDPLPNVAKRCEVRDAP